MRRDVLQVPRQALVYASGQMLSRGAAFLLIPLYTRYLTQEEYGILGVAAAVAGVLAILLGFGLEAVVVRFAFDRDREQQRELWGTLWVFLTAASLIISLLLDRFGVFLARAVFPGIAFDPLLRLVVWAAFFSLAGVIPLALFRARQQAFRYVLMSGGSFILTLTLTLYFVVFRDQGARGALEAQLLSAALFALPYTAVTLRNARVKIRGDQLASALAFSLPLVPHSLAGWALNLSDRIILQRFVRLDEVSVYYLGYQIGLLLNVLGTAVNNAWAPFFYRTVVDEGERAPRTLARLSTYGIAANVLAGLVLAAFAPEIVALLAPAGYERAAAVAGPVILAFVLQGVYFFAVNGLFAAKRTAPLPLVTVTAAVVNVGLNFLLIPRFGIMAAAWSTAAGFAVLLAGAWWLSQRAYPIPYEGRRLALLFLVAGAAALTTQGVRLPLGWSVVVKGAIVIAVPLTLRAVGFFPPRDRELLRRYLAGLRLRGNRESAP